MSKWKTTMEHSALLKPNVTYYGTVHREKQEKPKKCLCTLRDGILIVSLTCFILITVMMTLDLHPYTIRWNSSSPSSYYSARERVYRNAAVSSDDVRCSQIGSSMLAKNGSAVDAAISTLLCLEAVNPQHSGIGGGFFMTVYDKQAATSIVIDAREIAPNATRRIVSRVPLAIGGLAVAVPLTIRGYWYAHQKYGRLPWADLFSPTIDLCRNGFLVGNALAKALEDNRQVILEEETLKELFETTTGDLLSEGDLLRRPVFADTLEVLSIEGPNPFYTGRLSKNLIADVQSANGVLTAEDLRNAQIKVKVPLNVTIVKENLYALTVPPPGSGSLLIFLINLFEGFKRADQSTTFQRLVESIKFAFGQRTLLGDEDYVDVVQAVANQTSKAFAKYILTLIRDNTTFGPSYYLPENVTNVTNDGGTAHVSVVDPRGNAVAVTCTINHHFGAKFISRSLGIVLNDEMTDFGGSTANAVEPGKRPLSSMVPTLVIDKGKGDVVMVIGASGGTAILTSVANVFFHYFFLNETLKDSVAAFRFHHQLFPNVLKCEDSTPQEIVDSLRSFGHTINGTPPVSHVNGIVRQADDSWLAIGDPRTDSGTAGF